MNDRKKIENSIIPALFLEMMLLHSESSQEYKDAFKTAMRVCEGIVRFYINDDVKLTRRLKRIMNNYLHYYKNNKFDTRKSFLVLTAWTFALDEADAIDIYHEDFVYMMEDLSTTIKGGYSNIENFELIHESALKHVPKIHKLAQQHGYFENVAVNYGQ